MRLSANQPRQPCHVSRDGQMTVKRSWNILDDLKIWALTWENEWSYGDSNPRPLACHAT